MMWKLKIKKAAIEAIDANGDGVITVNEVLNPANIKLILVTIVSLMTPELITWISMCIDEGKYVSNGIESLLSLIAVPFILIYFFKSIVDDYQGRLKAKDSKITELSTELATEKADRKEDKAKSDLELMQMEGGLKAKDLEIEWIKKGYPVNP